VGWDTALDAWNKLTRAAPESDDTNRARTQLVVLGCWATSAVAVTDAPVASTRRPEPSVYRLQDCCPTPPQRRARPTLDTCDPHRTRNATSS